ncbi:CAZyme family CE10 [Agaricus bisporus var. burnettii]|uniref:CAZyme family CE10 n=1 Tax=Agaricus bisporus var. burnettii TaxID=192524 RepID=A0A8H7EZD9_AGABI|nr:CAZyme family CE10 [Agaricus bisporus var. burnettii]
MPQNLPPHTTLTYKSIGDHTTSLDVFPPIIRAITGNITPHYVPALVFFHGGGLTVGTRKSWFAHWLHRRTTESGITFISVDYQLMPPGTGHDVVSDIRDLFTFIGGDNTTFKTKVENTGDEIVCKIDINAIAVAGPSAGGLCAYLAAGIVQPKPKALLSLYGMGGDFLTPYYLEQKHEVFVPGREILDPNDFKEFLYPFSLPTLTGSELEYHPNDHPTPGLPANPRMRLGRLYLQLGNYLDYYTGDHSPSLSEVLRIKRREVLEDYRDDTTALRSEDWGAPLIPSDHRVLFPQLNVTPDWPEMLLVHGTDDYLVYLSESQNLKSIAEAAGVKVTLKTVEGKGHTFDLHPEAEVEFNDLFDEIKDFLKRKLVHP